MANYEYYRLMFGEPEKLLTSINNPEELIRRHQAAGERIPALFMACGTEDFLLENNRELRDFLQETRLHIRHLVHDQGRRKRECFGKMMVKLQRRKDYGKRKISILFRLFKKDGGVSYGAPQ